MSYETIYAVANIAALLSWLCLILLPRWRPLMATIQWGTVLGLSVLYTGLIALYFAEGTGGNVLSLAAVQALFQSPVAALAGWIHYLAFDLFVGLWIARRADEIGLNRLVQVPVLLLALLFAPIGLLAFHAILAARGGSALSQRSTPH